MLSTRRFRTLDRAAPYLAAALLAVPVVDGRMFGVRAGLASLVEERYALAFYESVPATLDVACIAAAALLLFRRTRGFAACLGLVAAAMAASASAIGRHYRWASVAPFEDLGLVWAATTAAALLVVVAREGWFPARRPDPPPRPRVQRPPLRTMLDVVPSWTVHVGGGTLVWLAVTKIQSSYYTKCLDPWGEANVAMASAELWTGLLALCPRTRPAGAFLGAALMEGAAVFAGYASLQGLSWRGCHCFGAFEYPWSVHAAVALAIAFVLAAAFVREATQWAYSAPSESPSNCDEVPIVAAVRGVLDAHRSYGARHPWAAPVAGVALLACAIPPVTNTLGDLAWSVIEFELPSAECVVPALLGAAGTLGGLWLLRPRTRLRGAWTGYVGSLVVVAYELIDLLTWLRRHEARVLELSEMSRWAPVIVPLAAATVCILAARTNRAARTAPLSPPAPAAATSAPRATALGRLRAAAPPR